MSDRRVKELTPEQEQGLIHTLPMWARKRLKRAEIMLTAHASNYCREKERAERAEADNAKLRACVAELVDNKIGTKKWFDAMRVAREFLEGTK